MCMVVISMDPCPKSPLAAKWLVYKAHRLVSLNSRLESNKAEEG